MLMKLADIVEKNTDLVAAVESLDNGKSITMARGDVGAVIKCIRYYAGWADKIHGKTIDVDPEMFHYTRSEPVRILCLSTKTKMSYLLLIPVYRLVSAARSSPGTSPSSCSRGRLAPPWPLVTLSS